MRKVLALGATVLFVGSVSIAGAQERLQQSSGGSSLGVGTGVGDVSGSANRVQALDRNTFLDRLSQPESVMGRVFALDLPQRKLMIETGGAGRMQDEGQEGKAGYGARTIVSFEMRLLGQTRRFRSLITEPEPGRLLVETDIQSETPTSFYSPLVFPLAVPDARFATVYVLDVAEAYARAIDNSATHGQSYKLCGPHEYTLLQLVRYVAQITHSPHLIIPLPKWASRIQAEIFEYLPGKPFSRNNYLSTLVPNVCACPFPETFGFKPTALEEIAPAYLGKSGMKSRYEQLRTHH